MTSSSNRTLSKISLLRTGYLFSNPIIVISSRYSSSVSALECDGIGKTGIFISVFKSILHFSATSFVFSIASGNSKNKAAISCLDLKYISGLPYLRLYISNFPEFAAFTSLIFSNTLWATASSCFI